MSTNIIGNMNEVQTTHLELQEFLTGTFIIGECLYVTHLLHPVVCKWSPLVTASFAGIKVLLALGFNKYREKKFSRKLLRPLMICARILNRGVKLVALLGMTCLLVRERALQRRMACLLVRERALQRRHLDVIKDILKKVRENVNGYYDIKREEWIGWFEEPYRKLMHLLVGDELNPDAFEKSVGVTKQAENTASKYGNAYKKDMTLAEYVVMATNNTTSTKGEDIENQDQACCSRLKTVGNCTSYTKPIMCGLSFVAIDYIILLFEYSRVTIFSDVDEIDVPAILHPEYSKSKKGPRSS